MRALAFVLLSILMAAGLGCTEQGTIYSVYDAKQDAVSCKRWTSSGFTEVWSEKGYVCHNLAGDRVRPYLNASNDINPTPEAH